MKPEPSHKSGLVMLVILAALFLATALTIINAHPSQTDILRPGAVVPMSTPTVIVLPPVRNATKDAQSVLEKQQFENARKTPAPSMTDVARKQPRQPLGAVAEVGMFKPLPGSVPAGSGAIVQVQPPFSNSQYHIENTWYADSDNATRRTLVFAGNVAGPGGQTTEQGVVVVQVLQYGVLDGAPALKTLETKTYTSTISAGSLHITGVTGNGLELRTSAGSTVTFNLTTRTYSAP